MVASRKMYKFQPWIPSYEYLIVFTFKLSAHISVYIDLQKLITVSWCCAHEICIQNPRPDLVLVNGDLEQKPDADGK